MKPILRCITLGTRKANGAQSCPSMREEEETKLIRARGSMEGQGETNCKLLRCRGGRERETDREGLCAQDLTGDLPSWRKEVVSQTTLG